MKRILYILSVSVVFSFFAFAQELVSLKETYSANVNSSRITSYISIPEQSHIVLSSNDGMIRVFDVTNGKELNGSKISDRPLTFLGYGNNSLYAITDDNKLHTITLPSLKLSASMDLQNKVTSTSSDDKNLYLGFANGEIKKFNFASNVIETINIKHSGAITALAFEKSKNILISAGDDLKIKLFDLNKNSFKSELIGNSNSKVVSISVSDDGLFCLTGHSDNFVKVWNLTEEKQIKNINEHNLPVMALTFDHLNSFFVSAGNDKMMYVWSLIDNKLQKSVNLKEGEPIFVSVTKDNRFITVGLLPNILKTFEVSSSITDLVSNNSDDGSVNDNSTLSRSKDLYDKIKIEIFEPKNTRGLKISGKANTISVKGKVTSPNKIKSLTINNAKVNLSSDNSFSYILTLSDKEKSILVQVFDVKNNYNEREIILDSDKSADDDFVLEKSSGSYYALIIGVDDYKDKKIPSLNNPSKDAKKLMEVLTSKYSFKKDNVIYLKNPSRSDLISELGKFRKRISDEDNFLIFYAGHGYWDKDISQGYWLPSDAEKDNRANWISNGDLRDNIRGINSKHTLLISDACFSGGIFKTRALLKDAPAAISEVYNLVSRKGMTSGTLTEVPDDSPFLKYLVKRLSENKQKYLTAESLFSSLKTAVINNSKQVPQYGEIQEAGDEGGDFIFILK